MAYALVVAPGPGPAQHEGTPVVRVHRCRCPSTGRFGWAWRADAADRPDVDHIQRHRLGARGVAAPVAVAAGVAQQPVDLPHPGPGQVDLQQAAGVDPDRRAMRVGLAAQVADVPQRIVGPALGKVRGVGGASAGGLAGMDLEERAPPEQVRPLTRHGGALDE